VTVDIMKTLLLQAQQTIRKVGVKFTFGQDQFLCECNVGLLLSFQNIWTLSRFQSANYDFVLDSGGETYIHSFLGVYFQTNFPNSLQESFSVFKEFTFSPNTLILSAETRCWYVPFNSKPSSWHILNQSWKAISIKRLVSNHYE